MNPLPPRSALHLFALMLLGASVHPVHATGNAVRGPATPGGELESVVNTTGVIELNAARSVVTSTLGFDSVSHVRVDSDAGTIRGYAEFALDSDTVVPVGEVVGGTAAGILTIANATVSAPESGVPYDIVFELPFDGRFDVLDGQPTLILSGDLSVTVIHSLFPLSGALFQSLLSFELSTVNPTYAPLPLFAGTQSLLDGSSPTPFAGATVEILGDTPDRLDAILRLELSVMAGDLVTVSAFVNGLAAPAPGDEFSDTELEVLSSAGVVDFFDTASLRILVPEGVRLVGDDPLLDSVVVTAPVPLPAAIWMLAPALALLRRHR